MGLLLFCSPVSNEVDYVVTFVGFKLSPSYGIKKHFGIIWELAYGSAILLCQMKSVLKLIRSC